MFVAIAGQCGQTTLEVTNKARTLKHPSNGGHYNNNEECSWTLTSRNLKSRIRITFASFATEVNYDTVTVSCNCK